MFVRAKKLFSKIPRNKSIRTLSNQSSIVLESSPFKSLATVSTQKETENHRTNEISLKKNPASQESWKARPSYMWEINASSSPTVSRDLVTPDERGHPTSPLFSLSHWRNKHLECILFVR